MPTETRIDQVTIYPVLRYRDAPAAIDWLVAAFGFQRLSVDAGADGTVGHAELNLGPGVIMLGSAPADEPAPPTGSRDAVYVALADVDAHYERAKAAGAEIVRELRQTDFDSREYSARDPEGNVWSFGTYRPHP